MNQKTDDAQRKPRLALAIATAFGLGYLPKAPGTFGSLVGVLLAWLSWAIPHMILIRTIRSIDERTGPMPVQETIRSIGFLIIAGTLATLISLIGIWAADRVASHLQKKDPQIVVIDEVAGQLISYLGLATAAEITLNGKYLLAGFILFRFFDVWKPFPIRRAESLPGGLGIMADDWLAGVYAALLLALARHFGF